MAAVRIENARVSVDIAPSREGWKSYRFNLHEFSDLTTTKKHYLLTPGFTCNGHEWALTLYPGGGSSESRDGYVSIYVRLRSELSTAATYAITVLDKFGNAERVRQNTDHLFDRNVLSLSSWGWYNFIKRSDILDASNNILDSSGTLAIVVSMKDEPTTAFVPQNPLLNAMRGMFNDKETADVCFKVADSAHSFHAHTFILQKCAPMLHDLIPRENDMENVESVQISDVQPDIFRHLLWYVYGGSVADDLKAHAKDIIDAADKYSIVNLKLEAEAAYVKSTTFTAENVLDNLLYADAMNLALLKEAVIDFLVGNGEQVIAEVTFSHIHIPGRVIMKDLLVATTRRVKGSKNEVTNDMNLMRVSELRRKLNEKGLDVDGSREAMIASLIRSGEFDHVGDDSLLEAEDELNEDESNAVEE